ncbi:SMI1/KNR4 family protein [Paenibacillus profundus]|uniref:SMI1/KNR4 family protein n=1 Tax=Paenibacillus profundus TaxID=1173085 RepID=A0ABS8YMB0_9BACL|nr:SMI1/KNR4 family protein [Paenibacillus profundus]MCE5170709.1 SMI1/KNR4 family protein [Paenibacillus profundus]
MRYNNILESIRKNPSKHNLEALSETELKKEIVEGIPKDYIDFLREVGYGTVNDTYFSFYSGLVEVDEIFDDLYDTEFRPELKEILLFGDNCSGDGVGFLTTANWSIVEIWHDDDLSINPRDEKTFEEFVVNMFEKFT